MSLSSILSTVAHGASAWVAIAAVLTPEDVSSIITESLRRSIFLGYAAYAVCQVMDPVQNNLKVLLGHSLILHEASKLSHLLLHLVDRCLRPSKMGMILTILVQLLKLKQKTGRRDLWADLSSPTPSSCSTATVHCTLRPARKILSVFEDGLSGY